jgi:hypothetical protein
MALANSQLYQLASFDPYTTMVQAPMQRRQAEMQAMATEQAYKEMQAEMGQQALPQMAGQTGQIPLAKMAQTALPADKYSDKDSAGNLTIAGQASPFVTQVAQLDQTLAKNQKEQRMAYLTGDKETAGRLAEESRRLIDRKTQAQGKVDEFIQKGQDSLVYQSALANGQEDYDKKVKAAMDKAGLKIRPPWLPEKWSPNLYDEISGYGSTALNETIQKRKDSEELMQMRKDAARKKEGGDGDKSRLTSQENKPLVEAESSLKLGKQILTKLNNPEVAKSLDKTQFLRTLLETPKEMTSVEKYIRTGFYEKLPKESQDLVTLLANMRNSYYRQQSGLAVTGGEAARNFFAVVQPTDDVATIKRKLAIQNQKNVDTLSNGIEDYKMPAPRQKRLQQLISESDVDEEDTSAESKDDPLGIRKK